MGIVFSKSCQAQLHHGLEPPGSLPRLLMGLRDGGPTCMMSIPLGDTLRGGRDGGEAAWEAWMRTSHLSISGLHSFDHDGPLQVSFRQGFGVQAGLWGTQAGHGSDPVSRMWPLYPCTSGGAQREHAGQENPNPWQ